MSLDRFVARFCAGVVGGAVVEPRLLGSVPGHDEFVRRWAGVSFARGLYRVHGARSGLLADSLVVSVFPEFAGHVSCFGFDWLGRQFAVDERRVGESGPQVLLLEPGTGEALEIPCGFADFHDEELVDFADAALAENFFEEWAGLDDAQLPLPFDKCVGYKVPLFLGGADVVENLEIVDTDIYWSLLSQLHQGLIELPVGTFVSHLSIS